MGKLPLEFFSGFDDIKKSPDLKLKGTLIF